MKKVGLTALGVMLSSLIISSGGQKPYGADVAAANESGTISLFANGEDFVRQGFVSKDDWKITFDHVYINFGAAAAYSTKSAFEPQKGLTKDRIKYTNKADFIDVPQTIDLAAGDSLATPILVAEANTPVDFYNALSWQLTTAKADSPAAKNTILLQGKASKDGQQTSFEIGFNQPVEYICGEYVGDERLGIVETTSPGKAEATLHFDHIFGDASTAADEALNLDALGFEPLAALAKSGKIKLNEADLRQNLSPQAYQQLSKAVIGLGHVGEGHCVVADQ